MKSACKEKGHSKKYIAYTLVEMLIVMSVVIIMMSMSFASFNGLQNTIKMNEYILTLEQNVRNVQRAAMLLERKSGENWIFGLGIDLSKVNEDTGKGTYRVFKWCSPFSDYGDITTKSFLPSFNPSAGYSIGTALSFGQNGYLPLPPSTPFTKSICTNDGSGRSSIAGLAGYETSLTPPKGKILLPKTEGGREFRYIVFESVSGRTFFYDQDGKIINYDGKGISVQSPKNFTLTIEPIRGGLKKEITVENLSGRIFTKNIE